MVKPLQDSKGPTHSGDRRQSARYPLIGTVSFQWKMADGSWCEATGLTGNIGKSGLFIECESLPPVACLLQLTVTLPTNWRPHTTLRLRGVGDVRHIRTEAPKALGYGARIAFRIESPVMVQMVT